MHRASTLNATFLLVLVLAAAIATMGVGRVSARAESPDSDPIAADPPRAYGHGAFVQELPTMPALPPTSLPGGLQPAIKAGSGSGPQVTRDVLGYIPYWTINSGYTVQRWDLLTILAWFGAEMDVAGNITSYHGWGGAATQALVDEAHANGVAVIVTITNFNDTQIGNLLKSASARATAIQSCLDLMATHNADGINIDFEFVPVSAKAEFVSFMAELKAAVVAAQPNGWDGHVSLAGPSVDWTGAYDYDLLLEATDGIMVMAYGYHYGGGNPGPTSPLVGGGGLSNKSVTTTIDEYLQFGGVENRHKVIIGLPWYGRDWRVANTDIPGVSLGGSGAVFFTQGETEAAAQGKQWHDLSKTAYYHINRNDGLYQVWYDDGQAFHDKIAYVDAQDLGGVGIWALGYDGTVPDLWNAIETVLGVPDVPPDAGPEAAPDAPPEAQAEPAVEAQPEVQPEAGPEAVAEPESDAAADAGAADAGGTVTTWMGTGVSSFVEEPGDGGCSGGGSGSAPWAGLLGLLVIAALRRRGLSA